MRVGEMKGTLELGAMWRSDERADLWKWRSARADEIALHTREACFPRLTSAPFLFSFSFSTRVGGDASSFVGLFGGKGLGRRARIPLTMRCSLSFLFRRQDAALHRRSTSRSIPLLRFVTLALLGGARDFNF